MNARVEHVSDTAFLTAYARAVETDRPDALFKDPLAARLLDERGRALGTSRKGGPNVLWTIVLRTTIIDEMILNAVQSGVDTVLNLGAGLDTRPYRMALPPELTWIEVDYPHMIAFKEERLKTETARCNLTRIALDLSDVDLRRRMLRELTGKRILILTEGLLPYLSVDEGAGLADDLRAVQAARGWIVDYISPQVVAFRKKMASTQDGPDNAPLKFDPPDWVPFFLQHGWRARDIRGLDDQARRVGRAMPLPWMMRVMMKLRSLVTPKPKPGTMPFAAYVLLEPVTP